MAKEQEQNPQNNMDTDTKDNVSGENFDEKETKENLDSQNNEEIEENEKNRGRVK